MIKKEQKFIVYKSENNYELRFGYVYLHADLLYKFDIWQDCYGGGKWKIDLENKKIILFGISHDFGKVPNKILQKAIDNIHNFNHLENIYNKINNTEISLKNFTIVY